MTECSINKLMNSEVIGFDIETCDPHLKQKGSGVYNGSGYIVGFALSTEDGVREYLDVAHPDTSESTRKNNLALVRDILSRPSIKVGANIIYDVDWTENFANIPVSGQLEDVQLAEPLIDEYASSYSLSNLAKKYNLREKAVGILEAQCERMGIKTDDPRKVLYKMPAKVVAEYAKVDAQLPLEIRKLQRKRLEEEGLYDLYKLECELIRVLVEMRRNGVRLNTKLLQTLKAEVLENIEKEEKSIYNFFGERFNILSNSKLGRLLELKGVTVPRKQPTELMRLKGKPGNYNLDKHVLHKLLSSGVRVAQNILNFKHLSTMKSMFIEPYEDLLVGDRLHCNFAQLRTDGYGTVSGRFSSFSPNLQQVSALSEEGFVKSEVLSGQVIRKLFVPEEACLWGKLDYSQVEYRIGAHYAQGPGAEEVRKAYIEDEECDFHSFIQELTGFDRRTAKRLNFGAGYGMGAKTAAETFGWSLKEAEQFLKKYHQAAPFIKFTRQKVVDKALRVGYVRTILNRRARVNESRSLHSMYNRLIQGSAADIMKKAMVDACKSGLFDVLKLHLTVHDELDVSIPNTAEGREAVKELGHVMENCVKLKVPLRVDPHIAENWAEAD